MVNQLNTGILPKVQLKLVDKNGDPIEGITGGKNQLWEISGGKMTLVTDDFAEGCYMTQPDTLRKFIKAASMKYPTKDSAEAEDTNMYDLIMWGHASGPEDGFGIDENDKQILYASKKIELIYTGAIDELFSYKFGVLPYRSLRFEFKSYEKESFQNVAIVAYPQEKGFTRITEC